MSMKITFTKVRDIPKTLDFLEYLVTVRKNGRFVKAVLYQGYSGHAMMDIVPDYRKQFHSEQGYTIEW